MLQNPIHSRMPIVITHHHLSLESCLSSEFAITPLQSLPLLFIGCGPSGHTSR
jgi:hypothetical protein